jgi:hypothetical protein
VKTDRPISSDVPSPSRGCPLRDMTEKLKDPSVKVRPGHAGAKARAQKLKADERSEIARKAEAGRWR